MADLIEEMKSRMQGALARKAINNAAKWACKYRFMGHPYPGKWTFDHHPWLREMHDFNGHGRNFEGMVCQKSAQMGATEACINQAFFFNDVKKMDVLYVLPNQNPDSSVFSSSRFNIALKLSEHLATLYNDVQNVGHKQAGTANLFVRGSNSDSQLKSLPVSLVVLDELDECNQANIPLALERTSGQLDPHHWMISTPTADDFGINYYFQNSTQDSFYFPCPKCSKWITFTYPESLVIIGKDENDPRVSESYLICTECKNKLEHEDKINFLKPGVWQAKYSTRLRRGFYINRLFGMNKHPSSIAIQYFQGLRDDFANKQFYNSTLGLTKTLADAKLTDEEINACISDYRMFYSPTGRLITMGVDVGKKLHCVVNDYDLQGRTGQDINSHALCRNLAHFELDDFSQLDSKMIEFKVSYCVIDAQPETRAALEFANRWYKMVKLCRYTRGIMGRMYKDSKVDLIMHVDRTSWLDMTLGRIKKGTILLPIDTLTDFKIHCKTIIKDIEKDDSGNLIARYITPHNKHDHYAHALNYAEIALPLALGFGPNETIRE